MKLSLAWIFDHIGSSWKEHTVSELFKKLHATTAEIEKVDYVTFDVSSYRLGRVVSIGNDLINLFSDELEQDIVVPFRQDVQKDLYYLITTTKNGWRWATGKDFYSEKETALPAFFVMQDDKKGAWKEKFEKEDYILTIGNTSITHRPDLWSHRGFAREIAAIIQSPLKSEDHFLADYPVEKTEGLATKNSNFNFEIDSQQCNALAGLYLTQIDNRPSSISIAHRLLRVDSKPINNIVDATNYVMFDIGQPMHAFDAHCFPSKRLRITQGNSEKLVLLDEQEINIVPTAAVVSNGKKPISLAGIMGGRDESITEQSKAVVVEAANFDATAIRSTAAHYKIRTESSTRFEKSLDPNQVVVAIKRFLHILDASNSKYSVPDAIHFIGKYRSERSIEVEHSFIEKKLGITVPELFILTILNALGFTARKDAHRNAYTITVPSFRSKDVTIAEDIVEEIGRFFGYDAVVQQLPEMPTIPKKNSVLEKIYTMKQFLAYCAGAFEVKNYALYDEDFLKMMQWQPRASLVLKNPISETMTKLVTSLIPNLFKTVCANKTHENERNFFEWNKIWPMDNASSDTIQEEASFAGIFFCEKKDVDFYEKKEALTQMLKIIGIESVWRKATENLAPWYHPYKTAVLMHNETILGYAGTINPAFIAPFLQGEGFIFEFNGDSIASIQPKKIEFSPLARYQDSSRDISMLVPTMVSVQQIIDVIKKANSLIFDVVLVDFFEKKEWHDKRSITIRLFIRDLNKTLSTDEIDAVYNQVLDQLKPLGTEVR